MERISAKDGGLAPTMTELIGESRFEMSHMHALERFLVRCRELHIVFGDLTVNNIVYTEARDPRGEFVAVDGFGEKSVIPIHRWSTLLNGRKIERVRKRLLSAVPARLKEAAAA